MDNKMINEKIVEIRNFENEIKQMQEVVDSLKDELKNEMTARGVDELDTGTFKMSYKDVVSNRFDSKAFQKDNEIIYIKFSIKLNCYNKKALLILQSSAIYI